MRIDWAMKAADPRQVSTLQNALRCHRLTARLLVNRGILAPEEARAFTAPSLSFLRPPAVLRDMAPAAQRLARAVIGKEPILIFGDYDADGVTAAALLHTFLIHCNADVRVHLPHRIREGYGLQEIHIVRPALSNRIGLIVTVDCGCASHRALAAAKSAGIDVIVTDHHQVSDPLPEAVAVVNPCRPDCPSNMAFLSGAGVCFYLLIALRQQLREAGFWKGRIEPNLRDYCDLVALGTVADMVPLQQENRILVRAGLDVLNAAPRPGMAGLMAAAGVDRPWADAEDLAFRLAPRINAAGRMAHAMAAFRLLTATDRSSARRITALLDRLNDRRREKEAQMLAQAQETLERKPELSRRRTLVLSHSHWPEGILGIVASRLVRKFHRPVVLISTRSGTGKGSARSIPGIDLHGALARVSDSLDRFGGHAMAAGITIAADRIEEFEHRLEEAVCRSADPEAFVKTLPIDAEVSFSEISEPLMEEIDALRPFGEGNPEPLLMARSIDVVSAKPAGADHLRLQLRQDNGAGGRTFEAIRFGAGTHLRRNRFERIAFQLRWNRWRGRRRLQIVIQAVDDE